MIVLIVALVVVIAAAAGVGIYAMRYANYDKIMPNVFVAGVDVGGMTKEEAKSALESELLKNTEQSLNVVLPDQVLTFAPKADTVHIDVNSAVDEAYAYGRSRTSPFAISRAIQAAQRHKYEVELTDAVSVDSAYITEMINSAAATVTTELVDSAVVPDMENHSITVTIGSPGRTLDTEELYNRVCDAFTKSDYSDITFEYDMLYPATVQLDSLYQDMTTEPKNAVYNKDTGEIDAEIPGFVPTMTLDKANEQLATAAPGDVLTFTFDPTEPEVTAAELDSLLFRDVLSSFGSVYEYNYNRTINLELACDAINGTVLQPGDVFSFNDVVGERTAEKGYREGIVYVSGNSESELGGGVCQVASTIYYCAMLADLEIVQREEHQFLVTYVPGGLDATVYWGNLDFQFKNSTDYPLKINAYLYNGRCYIELIGTNVDGTYCELESERTAYEPCSISYTTDASKVQSGYDGSTYVVTRYVYDANGQLIRTDSTADLDSGSCRLGTSKYSKRDKVVYGGGSYYTPTETTSPSTSPSAEPSASPSAEPTDPGTSDPGTSDPGTTDPGTTDPGTTDPGTTDPGTSDPGTSDPGTADPGTGDSGGGDTGGDVVE